jgi:gamma-glutamylcyclotransferase (GGCT)/AIG2-like uncharacterized protein YtfP
MKYYFAYGSNLNKKQMMQRCPQCEIVGTTKLDGYRLAYFKYLTILPDKDESIPIAIYKITDEDEKRLDKFEGIDSGVYNKKMINIEFNDKKIKCLTYVMSELSMKYSKPPSIQYMQACEQGYEDFDFKKKHLKHAFKNKD